MSGQRINFLAGGVNYEFLLSDWDKICAGESDAPIPVLRALLKTHVAKIAELQREIAILRQKVTGA